MIKQLVILLLEFGAGLAGNLIAGWIQNELWVNAFSQNRVLGTIIGAAAMLLLLYLMERGKALHWGWRWHRFWCLFELTKDPKLRHWEKNFAGLEFKKRTKAILSTDVIINDRRCDLVEVLHGLIYNRGDSACRVLILGEPGSGKSTGLERLTFELAREGVKKTGIGTVLPILIRLGVHCTPKVGHSC